MECGGRRRLAVAVLALMPVLPIPEPAVGLEGSFCGQRLEIRFDPDAYGPLPDGFVAFTGKDPFWARQAMVSHPGTRVRLVRDHDYLARNDESPHHEGSYEGWLYLNGTGPTTGMPQRLIEGGTDDYGDIAGCAGIDLFPDRIRLVIRWFHLFPLGLREPSRLVSERDAWMLLVSFGPRPEAEWDRCNGDPEGIGTL